MGTIKIKCPTCGKVLRLQDAPNINAASFTCPVCHEKHVVGQCQRVVDQPKSAAPMGEETQYGPAPKQSYGEETRIFSGGGYTTGEETSIGQAPSANVGKLVDANGAIYPLRIGNNILGRKAASSMASIQIATNDRTMSRSHAVIEVSQAGGQMLHIIKNDENKNPSYLNGTLIGQQDQLVLNNGDRLRMGNTELTFKL